MKTAVGSVIFEEASKYLGDFFESLETQTDQDFSVILINDNISSEHLEKIIAGVSPGLKDRLYIGNRNGKKLSPGMLRVELLQEAFSLKTDLLIIIRHPSCNPVMSADRLKPPDLILILKSDSVHLIGAVLF